MENANNYHTISDSDNQKFSFLFFSILGWLTYLVCGWISLIWLNKNITIPDRFNYSFVMTIYRLQLVEEYGENYGIVYPLQMQTSLIYVVIILTMTFALFAFIIFIVKSTCKKEEEVLNGMLGGWTKFHFVPLFIAAGLFLIGICYSQTDDPDWKSANIAGIILNILGLVFLIFIYVKTELSGDWLTAIIKKGAYSTLIALEWYYLCYIICNLVIIDYEIDKYNKKERIDGVRNCGIVMPIIEGIGSLVFAFIFKDVIVAFMNILIFLGASIYFLSIESDTRNYFGGHDDAEGIIDIIFSSLSLVVMVLLIIWRRKECLK